LPANNNGSTNAKTRRIRGHACDIAPSSSAEGGEQHCATGESVERRAGRPLSPSATTHSLLCFMCSTCVAPCYCPERDIPALPRGTDHAFPFNLPFTTVPCSPTCALHRALMGKAQTWTWGVCGARGAYLHLKEWLNANAFDCKSKGRRFESPRGH
jgi:hypothetical protein